MKRKNIHLKIIKAIVFIIVIYSADTLFAQDPFPGTALSFDGIYNYVECGDVGSIGISNEMTIEAWIKVSSEFSADLRVGIIIGNYDHSPNFNLEGHTSGRLRFFWNGGEVDVYASDFDMRDDNWHHIAVTRDSVANQIIFYIDGQIKGIYPSGSNANYQWPLRIGRDFTSNPAFPFNGVIDEVRIWNVVRTTQEIRENMHLTLTGGETGLIALWQFNEESGDIANDPIGGNYGTLYSFSEEDRIVSTIPSGSGASFHEFPVSCVKHSINEFHQ